MHRNAAWAVAIALGVVFGWVAGAGVTLLSDDTSGPGDGGPVLAEWLVGIAVGGLVLVLAAMGLQRSARNGAEEVANRER